MKSYPRWGATGNEVVAQGGKNTLKHRSISNNNIIIMIIVIAMFNVFMSQSQTHDPYHKVIV